MSRPAQFDDGRRICLCSSLGTLTNQRLNKRPDSADRTITWSCGLPSSQRTRSGRLEHDIRWVSNGGESCRPKHEWRWREQVVESIRSSQLQLVLIRDIPHLPTTLIHLRLLQQSEVAAETVRLPCARIELAACRRQRLLGLPPGSFLTRNGCKEGIKDNFRRRQPR